MAENNKNSGQGTQATQGQSHQGQGNQHRGNQGQGGTGQGGQNKGGQQGGQGGQSQGGQSQGGAGGVTQMARDAATSVAHGASGAMHAVAEQASHAAENLSGGVRSLASSLREHAPSEGMLGTAAGSVADTLEGSTRYLTDGGFNTMIDDVSGMVRRNPIPCMLCTLAFGFVLGRLLTSGSDNTRSY